MARYYARCTGEDPDDLIQEAWIGLFEGLSDVDMEIGSPEAYLVQRARWRTLDAIKRAKVRRCSSLDDDPSLADLRHTARNAAVEDVCVSEFVENLSDTQRAIVDCLLQGHTWRGVGGIIGCSSANVAYHVRQIRQRYEEWADDPQLVS